MNRLLKAISLGLAISAPICRAEGPSFGVSSDPFPAADAAAWVLVALLVFCIICFTYSACLLNRRSKGSQSAASEDKSEHSLPPLRNGDFPASRGPDKKAERTDNAPWEKDGDWWKE